MRDDPSQRGGRRSRSGPASSERSLGCAATGACPMTGRSHRTRPTKRRRQHAGRSRSCGRGEATVVPTAESLAWHQLNLRQNANTVNFRNTWRCPVATNRTLAKPANRLSMRRSLGDRRFASELGRLREVGERQRHDGGSRGRESPQFAGCATGGPYDSRRTLRTTRSRFALSFFSTTGATEPIAPVAPTAAAFLQFLQWRVSGWSSTPAGGER